MWDQSLEGTDSGWSNTSGGRLEVLPVAQNRTSQNKTVNVVSHQWPPESLLDHKSGAIDSWMTSNVGTMPPLNDVGTVTPPAQIIDSVGHRRRRYHPSRAVLTLDSTSHVRVETTNVSGKKTLGSRRAFEGSKIRDKESGLTFLEPGRYEREKSNRPKKSAHRGLPGVKFFWQIWYTPDSYDRSRR